LGAVAECGDNAPDRLRIMKKILAELGLQGHAHF
jgi:hypothetical protein